MFKLIILAAPLLLCIVIAEAAKMYRVDKYKLCDDVTDSAAKFSEFHVVGKSQAISITGTMEVTRMAKMPLQFHLMVNRCDVDQSNCEHFDTIVFEDVCAMYNESHLMKAHMAFFSPPLTCPLNIGKYTSKDGLMDMKMFEIFPIGNAHWQAEMRLIDAANKTATCVWSEVTILEKDM